MAIDEFAAGRLAVEHTLRGFDAIHLAAALELHCAVGGSTVAFTSFDVHLNAAARAEGLHVLAVEAESPGRT